MPPQAATFVLFFLGIVLCLLGQPIAISAAEGLKITWADRHLTVMGPKMPGDSMQIYYLEAYCRPGSTDRDWHETVIPHESRLTGASEDQRRIELEDILADGVVVRHRLIAGEDDVTMELEAHNPTDRPSEVSWAQPCVRIDRFTGCSPDHAREVFPPYIRQCFLYVDGKATRLPTEPWATRAYYVPGQVYCPRHVDRRDVNPRPLSEVVPSHGLCGCYSADGTQIFATAWEPYQEIFQGVITCLHNDFRVGGLMPGETKKIRGKLYYVSADLDALWQRFQRDFPEQ